MTDLNKKVDDLEEAKEKYLSENTVISIGGYAFTPAKLMIAGGIVSSILGGLYGTFEVYKDYMDMKKAIQTYVAPDLSAIQEQQNLMKKEMEKVKESVSEAKDYTRDIKNDLKKDMGRIETVTDKTEQRMKDVQEQARTSIGQNEDKVRNLIEIASQRFETKRDELRNDNDRKMKELEQRINDKIQKALDNPLAK